MKTVLVTGATGFVGQEVVHALLRQSMRPLILTRRPDVARRLWGNHCDYEMGSPTAYDSAWAGRLNGIYGVIHLAGENIFGQRWTPSFKQALYESRVQSTENLVTAIAAAARKPEVFVSASAVGFYGDCGDRVLTEDAPPGTDFLSLLATDWEHAAAKARGDGVRVAIMRLGVVLGAGGGMLERLTPIFRAGLGGVLGHGRQWMSWIHRDDVVQAVVRALADGNAFSGVFNATSPYPVTNREFTEELGRILRRPTIAWVPASILRLALGEGAVVALSSQRAIPERLLDLGFSFKYPTCHAALQASIGSRQLGA